MKLKTRLSICKKSKRSGGLLIVALALCLYWQCGSDGVLPEPAAVAGITDLDNYVNLSFTDLGNVGDLNGSGEWHEKGGGGGTRRKLYLC